MSFSKESDVLAVSVKDRSLRSHNLSKRIVSGVLLSVVALGSVFMGGWMFTAIFSLVVMVGLWEFLRMGIKAGYPILLIPGMVTGAAILVLGLTHTSENVGVVVVATAVWMIGWSVRPPMERRLLGLALTVLGILYVIGLGLFVFWIRELQSGLGILLVVLLGTWAADTSAFFFGIRFGNRPLAPEISPGKTVEGLFGGVVGSFLVVFVATRFLLPDLGILLSVGLGLTIGILSPLGDLLESMIKRSFEMKDASHIIPGHGGVLDRIDSLLVTAPVAYYLVYFLYP